MVVLTVAPRCDGARREAGLGLLRFARAILASGGPSSLGASALGASSAAVARSPWALRSTAVFYSAADRLVLGTQGSLEALAALATAEPCAAAVPSLATPKACAAPSSGWRLQLAKGTMCHG